ncbi:lycopene cyclase domain-containing protein [Candidatus Saccharibacteria bacterium]|nr:lycopene cyclase domain-containing protein [Candidatus Saccharibacteria bacterium]
MNWLYSHWVYSAILSFSIMGLALADWRHHLVFWASKSTAKRATLATLAVMVAFFLVWDIAGIILGIFFTNPRYTLGLNLVSPNLPIEEVGFLILLNYSILVLDEVWRRFMGRSQKKTKAIRLRKKSGVAK